MARPAMLFRKMGELRYILLIVGLLLAIYPRSAKADTPSPSASDLFDVSQGITIIRHTPIYVRADARDIFGGTFGTLPEEGSHTVFADGSPAGTAHSVEWRTATPIRLERFALFASHGEGSPQARGMRMFRLFAQQADGTFAQIYESPPLAPYGGGPAGNELAHAVDLTPFVSQRFRAEFVQYGSEGAVGPRIIELDGFGEALPAVNIQPTADDVWDVSKGIEITSSGPISSPGSIRNIRNMFGGESEDSGERLNTLFADGFPTETTHWVEWKTPLPVTLKHINLFAAHDGPGGIGERELRDAQYRGFSRVTLYGRPSGETSYTKLYEYNPANPYGGGERFSTLELSADVGPTQAQEFRAEFVQFGNINPIASGPRIFELDGFGEAQETRNPVVLVPALMTSFNYQALLRDRDGGAWRFVPLFGNLYQALIERLVAAGYEEGKDLIIAHYDWRQPIAESAIEYLMPAIDKVKETSGIGPNGKVDLVTHSMGGLVARQYIRSAQYRNDVDQLILLGTPNEGAADAYVAWESGEFPGRWGAGTKMYIEIVEAALKRARDIELEPPLSFRTLFPSLKELLPIQDFVTRDGTQIARSELAEQNPFLERLKSDLALLAEHARVQAIIGDQLPTLEKVSLAGTRTAEDRVLDRWRDGHPNPDPPQTDTTAGDQTVPIASASVGEISAILPGVRHIKLPEEAQEEVLELLGREINGLHLAYDQPDSTLGILVLSPIEPTITCNGHTLSKSENSFPNAEYVADENDPNGPKLLIIGDPPNGTCAINLRGIGDGPYSVVTIYSDEDETLTMEKEGNIANGEDKESTILITENSARPSPQDVATLVERLNNTVRNLTRDQMVHGPKIGKLVTYADKAAGLARAYANTGKEKEYKKLKNVIAQFKKELMRQSDRGNLNDTAIAELTRLRQELEDAGL